MRAARWIIGGAAALLMVGTLTVTVFARTPAESTGNGANATVYPLCAVESCTRVGYHTHSGKFYAPHSETDGHNYHAASQMAGTNASAQTLDVKRGSTSAQDAQPQAAEPSLAICPLQGCLQTGVHEHNGVNYAGHQNEDGHAYHSSESVCPVQGCTQAGPHTHDGVAYTGHHNEDGHSYHSTETLCPVQGCTQSGPHAHDGVSYTGHHNADGHSYHNQSSQGGYGGYGGHGGHGGGHSGGRGGHH